MNAGLSTPSSCSTTARTATPGGCRPSRVITKRPCSTKANRCCGLCTMAWRLSNSARPTATRGANSGRHPRPPRSRSPTGGASLAAGTTTRDPPMSASVAWAPRSR
jgi:hypothetical protein